MDGVQFHVTLILLLSHRSYTHKKKPNTTAMRRPDFNWFNCMIQKKKGGNKSAFKINNGNSIFTFWKLYTVRRNDYFNEKTIWYKKITKIIVLGSHKIPILHSYIFFSMVLSRILYNVTSGSKYLHDTKLFILLIYRC